MAKPCWPSKLRHHYSAEMISQVATVVQTLPVKISGMCVNPWISNEKLRALVTFVFNDYGSEGVFEKIKPYFIYIKTKENNLIILFHFTSPVCFMLEEWRVGARTEAEPAFATLWPILMNNIQNFYSK